MELYTPEEYVANYSASGVDKCRAPFWKLLLLGMLAGALIGFAALTTNMAGFAIENVSVVRIVSGVLFGFGLGLVLLTGSELFTGNTLMIISVLDRRIRVVEMLRNWGLVYIGNFISAFVLSLLTARFNFFGAGNSGLADFTMRVACAKMTMPFANAFVMGVLCNMLVVLGVLLGQAGKDGTSRILGAWAPVMLFVVCGFNHCIADMTYCMSGLFCMKYYANHAAGLTGMNWGSFLTGNLLPVTLGNIVGGCGIGAVMWLCYSMRPDGKKKAENNEKSS